MTKHSNFVIPWSNCVQLSRNALHLHDPMLPNECVLYMCNTCDKYSSSPIQRALRVTKYISVGANCQQDLVDQDKSQPCGDTFCHKISNWHPHPTKQSMYDAPLGRFWWFTLEVEATITFIWPECGDQNIRKLETGGVRLKRLKPLCMEIRDKSRVPGIPPPCFLPWESSSILQQGFILIFG